jgi:hypothetical protein
MRTTGDRSELYVELPDVVEAADGAYAFTDGRKLSVEAFLVSKLGEKLDLDVEATVGGVGPIKMLRLSNPALEWKHRDYKFRSLVLRANRSLMVGRIVWISYDPQSTKSGAKMPDAFDKP